MTKLSIGQNSNKDPANVNKTQFQSVTKQKAKKKSSVSFYLMLQPKLWQKLTIYQFYKFVFNSKCDKTMIGKNSNYNKTQIITKLKFLLTKIVTK